MYSKLLRHDTNKGLIETFNLCLSYAQARSTLMLMYATDLEISLSRIQSLIPHFISSSTMECMDYNIPSTYFYFISFFVSFYFFFLDHKKTDRIKTIGFAINNFRSNLPVIKKKKNPEYNHPIKPITLWAS